MSRVFRVQKLEKVQLCSDCSLLKAHIVGVKNIRSGSQAVTSLSSSRARKTQWQTQDERWVWLAKVKASSVFTASCSESNCASPILVTWSGFGLASGEAQQLDVHNAFLS